MSTIPQDQRRPQQQLNHKNDIPSSTSQRTSFVSTKQWNKFSFRNSAPVQSMPFDLRLLLSNVAVGVLVMSLFINISPHPSNSMRDKKYIFDTKNITRVDIDISQLTIAKVAVKTDGISLARVDVATSSVSINKVCALWRWTMPTSNKTKKKKKKKCPKSDKKFKIVGKGKEALRKYAEENDGI